MEYGNIVEYDPASGLGRILTTEGRSLFFQQFGAFTIGQLVCFKLENCAVQVKPASGKSSLTVIDAPNDAANAAPRFNRDYHQQYKDSECIDSQEKPAATTIDCGTLSDSGNDLKSPTFRPWND